MPNEDLALAVKANLAMIKCAAEQIDILERTVTERVKLRAAFGFLKTVPGIGQILALTIMLETAEIKRFPTVGDYASYCRCVGSQVLSNGKKKGSGNTKNGNKYLAWAFVEAANFAIRYNAKIKSFYQRKKAKSHDQMVRPRRGPQLGWTPARVSQRICESYNLGHGVVPTVFWGKNCCRGRAEISFENSPTALILMGDWCGPRTDTERSKTGVRDLDDQKLTS